MIGDKYVSIEMYQEVCRERDGAQKQYEAAKLRVHRVMEDRVQVDTENDRLRAELAAAREDTARLDWLEQMPKFKGKPWLITERVDGVWTIRQALDAARGKR